MWTKERNFMIYNQLINRVLNLAYDAHNGQKDKSGVPYIFHPYHLAEQMNTQDEVITALLHDVLEDTKTTVDEIRNIGVGEDIIEALQLLTHDKKTPYLDYIANLKDNVLAKKVKLADLRHNSDESRLEADNEFTRKRREKYAKAIQILTQGDE